MTPPCLMTFTFSLPIPSLQGFLGAPQITSQPVSSIFLCSPLPSGSWQTPGLFIPWCCLPTSFTVCLVFFPPFTVKEKLLLSRTIQENASQKNERYWTDGQNTALSCTITRLVSWCFKPSQPQQQISISTELYPDRHRWWPHHPMQRSGGCSTIIEEREVIWSQQHPSRTGPWLQAGGEAVITDLKTVCLTTPLQQMYYSGLITPIPT